ncbi:DEAD/DEAH box helicase family protein [Clostridium beijerinckii]|jgi:superfamily II DNA or RNA helicase/HKD family nuclease|uniref:DEAD/DEAH box helicase family protein n=2 Tax=Clostridium beijerinckii TaxID=1520 RepID=A0AAE2RVG5_CLOBE|nr:DEAD/DEAH box helicase family protein [Clostridium beijerinckii]ABR34960.1 type III restriction protein, res subunit [Clostridium beijerinckii NCIMB 8052]AIU02476.1 type III restriction protein, res subunit [Clostridium beijerinckii ATCC 35702]MBF7810404.1 DEAD/DEAH box helicase family protein [Clostridium beijerinckii]NRT23670.1 superfamily II DNA or RNA helicase [Clostridium beijerinckii]NRT68750.1 superfamily II DNA or RNA helicase [Clostridium beijerinckii]
MSVLKDIEAEKLNIIEKEAVFTPEHTNVSELGNVSTGYDNHLYTKLKESIKNAKAIDIIVSFLMDSGVKMILKDLKEAIDRNVSIRILTGSYLNITSPTALYMLKGALKDKVDLRFYNVHNKSFHPKSYIFHNDNDSEIYIGSSNLSKGALTDSIEWNYRFLRSQNPEDFNEFYNEFENLFLNYSEIINDDVMKAYSKNWKRPQVYKDIEKAKEKDNDEFEPKEIEGNKVIELFEPKGAQIEALYELENSREEGFDKGLVVAATGVGKTYLAAFDSKEAERVLFVAHREEIIKQAAISFKNVRNSDDIGFFYNNTKDNDKSMIFSLVQTLGKDEYLKEEYFTRDYFDYIVIDEFHHAVSSNYRKIIDYFTPKFLLGLTATPERLDSKDVFSLCDYNTVYEIRLSDAINKGYLVPFRYYGIYDETVNYDEVEFRNGKYNDKELEEALMLNKRGELILNHYKKYNSNRALGFCTSRKHAEYMAKYFCENRITSLAVYSGENGEYSENRTEALNKLTKGEVKVIFSVDMFNEGLDIPSIDMVMFLRPTQSPTVFLQQLGRGLRKYKDKKYLNVLDFIGNYKKADLLPFLLSGKTYSRIEAKKGIFNEEEYPEDCRVDFDFRIIDVFKKLAAKEMNIKDKILEEFLRVKELVGHRPSRVEFYNNIDDEVYSAIKKTKSSLNPFNDYLGFLKENGELFESEEALFNNIGHDFIKMIETTKMSKSYKITVFLAFYNGGKVKMEIDEEDVYRSFYEFYHKGSNKVDMIRDKGTADFEKWDKKKYIKLAKDNPVKFLIKSEGKFFDNGENKLMVLMKDMRDVIVDEEFVGHMRDAIMYRAERYYEERSFSNYK